MGGKERESNGYGGSVGSDGQPVDLKIQNGFAAATDYKQILYHNSVGSSSNTLRTYKRRKNHTHNEKVSESLQVQVNEKFATEVSDMHAEKEQIEIKGTYKIRTCKCCKEKADVEDSLVCDSCEEMYHVSCIKPALKKIPSRSWYCASCTCKGIESPHENCVVCERVNASRLPGNTDAVVEVISDDDLEESSNGLVENDVLLQLSKEKTMPCCKVCKAEVESGKDFRICGYVTCPHKFYHARCLNKKQLNYFGPSLWYCPSCLCRACFIDRDDEKIVLCDACDDAYHIYCMVPARTMIPIGKWYCSKCDSELRRIRKVKRTYENLQISNLPEQRKASHEDSSVSGRDKEVLENSGHASESCDKAE